MVRGCGKAITRAIRDHDYCPPFGKIAQQETLADASSNNGVYSTENVVKKNDFR